MKENGRKNKASVQNQLPDGITTLIREANRLAGSKWRKAGNRFYRHEDSRGKQEVEVAVNRSILTRRVKRAEVVIRDCKENNNPRRTPTAPITRIHIDLLTGDIDGRATDDDVQNVIQILAAKHKRDRLQFRLYDIITGGNPTTRAERRAASRIR